MELSRQTVYGGGLLLLLLGGSFASFLIKKPVQKKIILVPADTPITVAGGSIVAKTSDSHGWTPINSGGTVIGYQSVSSSNLYAFVIVEYGTATSTPLTRPWQAHFTFREKGKPEPDPKDDKRGMILCSDFDTAKAKCVDPGGTQDGQNNLYIVSIDPQDSIIPAWVDDTAGAAPSRVEFQAAADCSHCNHITNVIIKYEKGHQNKIPCTNSQCMLYTYNSASGMP
jgi:hypothetical protein